MVPPACKVIDEFAFGNCTGLSYADVQGADTISTKAFYHCSVLSTLKLPETLKAIGDSAFMRCEALATITLPASLERAGDKMFLRCPYFEGFTVAQGNAHFVAENGVLYSKDKTVLYECPQLYTADVFTVPATVKTIRPKAFFECNHVMNGIAFGQSSQARYIKTRQSFDICYTIEENTHKRGDIQLQIIDIRPRTAEK